MSQAGGLNSNGGGSGNVQTLTGNTGGAVPATANNINVVGTGTISVAGNPGTSTLTISSSAPTGVSTIGLQTGTTPISPTGGGLVTFNGAVVAAGTNPVRTDGTGANTMALEVQTAQAIASTDATKIGLASFNSADFTVDANGFVSSAGGGSGITTIDGDTGSVTGSTVSIISNVASNAAGATVQFSGSGTTLTYSNTDGNSNTAIGNLAGASATTLENCVFLGENAGNSSSNIIGGTFIGVGAGSGAAGSNNSTYVGNGAGNSGTSTDSTFVGANTAGGSTGCNNSTFIGRSAAVFANGCTDCVFIGNDVGTNTSSVTNGVVIGVNAIASGSSNIAIGNGAGSGSSSNTAVGQNALHSATNTVENVAIGVGTLASMVNGGNDNTAVGKNCLTSLTSGSSNLAVGQQAMQSATSLNNSVCLGVVAGGSLSTGDANTAIGANALQSCASGTENISIGHSSASSYNGSESSNIIIGNAGSNGESNVIRIGTDGSSTAQQNTCYVAGIAGVAVSNTEMVTIDTTTGQLGSQSVPTFIDLHTAKFIVGDTSNGANYATVAAALTAASSGDTIFLQTGTYTENLTLKAGVNLCAFDCDSINGTVKIVGKSTLTTAGLVTISGIRLQTNSDFLLAVTGSAASVVYLKNCNINCANNTGISFTSSDAGAAIVLNDSNGDIGTTGIAVFAHSSAGNLRFEETGINNNGASTTASTCSSGNISLINSQFASPITVSGTGGIQNFNPVISTSGINTTALIAGGSGVQFSTGGHYSSGTASAISVGTGAALSLMLASIQSTNTNAITGVGTLNRGLLVFLNSSTINTSTQNALATI